VLTLVHPNDIAICNVENSGFSDCLAHYASVLVKRIMDATRTLSVVIPDMHGSLKKETVLASPQQTDKAAPTKLALVDRSDSTIVSVSVASNDISYTINTFPSKK